MGWKGAVVFVFAVGLFIAATLRFDAHLRHLVDIQTTAGNRISLLENLVRLQTMHEFEDHAVQKLVSQEITIIGAHLRHLVDIQTTAGNRIALLEHLVRLQIMHEFEDHAVQKLVPQEITVIGVRGETGRVVPVKLVTNLPDVASIKIGNTAQELALSDWRPYERVINWQIPSGRIEKSIYITTLNKDGGERFYKTDVPDWRPALGFEYDYGPVSARYDYRLQGNVFDQTFENKNEQWVSYAYHGNEHNSGNVYYPLSIGSRDGSNGAYGWSDDSRWVIDTPEQPHSVLALMTYTEWAGCKSVHGDLDISFSLSGRNLDLKGGRVSFWFTNGDARFHTAAPLTLPGTGWGQFEIRIAAEDAANWQMSWSRDGREGKFDLANGIDSIGIAIRGFENGVKPTGVLAIDDFKIRSSALAVCR